MSRVFDTDVAEYSVVYKEDDRLKKLSFDTFAKASGTASALINVVRFINVSFTSPNGDSSVSGSLYCIGTNNIKRVCSRHLVNAVTKRKGI